MLRRAFLTASLAASSFALTGCGSAGGPVLRVGSQRGGAKSLMLASGVLEGAPYAVDWSEFPAAQHLLEAVGAGAVDLGGVSDAPFLFAFAGGAKVRAVHASRGYGGGGGAAILVPKDSDIRTVADLKGKRVACGRGSINHYLVLWRLQEAGLSAKDVEFAFLAPGDAKAAFNSGAVAAWSIWGPYLHLAVRDDGARVLSDGQGALSSLIFQAANADVIAPKAAQLADFLARLSRAQRWSDTHRAEYAAVLAKETGLDLDIARRTVDTGRGQPVPIDATVLAEEQRVLDVFRAQGAITTAPDLAGAFDTRFRAAVEA